jgi:UDP-galactose transporter B1
MITSGITIFMGMGSGKKINTKSSTGKESTTLFANVIGVTYLLINLALDGATNSTQDEIFARYEVTGQQMMFWINIFCTVLTTFISTLPLPYIPVIHPSPGGRAELITTLAFIRTHPSVVFPLFQFALTGALGQLFIFETLQHFGSLTLVYVFHTARTILY